ncbi:hypothetical protein LTR53_003576 [Teratosphaeriaceae sp. CCFEE 6253]|nr:hypothetical protein LTR53_003576 [Teratosphaeriaceae sp. CCFEE 6253]
MSALIGERWEPSMPSLNKNTEEPTIHSKVLQQACPVEQQTMHDTGSDAIPDSSPESHPVVPDFSTLNLHATHLINSPYTSLANQLQLSTLDPPTALFALALTFLTQTRAEYATAPYASAFNWPTVFSALRDLCHRHSLPWQRHAFHVVIFRSTRRRDFDPDPDLIRQLDPESHHEACESGGLLKYWFGSVDGEMRNLATYAPHDLQESHGTDGNPALASHASWFTSRAPRLALTLLIRGFTWRRRRGQTRGHEGRNRGVRGETPGGAADARCAERFETEFVALEARVIMVGEVSARPVQDVDTPVPKQEIAELEMCAVETDAPPPGSEGEIE